MAFRVDDSSLSCKHMKVRYNKICLPLQDSRLSLQKNPSIILLHVFRVYRNIYPFFSPKESLAGERSLLEGKVN